MSFRRLIVVVCLFLLLAGCGGSRREPTQQALDFRNAMMEADACSFTARVTADFGEQVYGFTLACTHADGSTKLEVTEPEAIAGIKAVVAGRDACLEFDGVSLELGLLADGRISAVAAPWLLCQCWEGEYIAYAGADAEEQRVTYLRGYEDDQVTVDTWFRDQVPTYAEVVYDNTRCLTVEITDFMMQ